MAGLKDEERSDCIEYELDPGMGLTDYITPVPEVQKSMYDFSGKSFTSIRDSPTLEIRKKGFEVPPAR